MPCYRCGTRQTDPDRGASVWKRGVRAGHQVLVCPTCQQVHDWTGDLDRCTACGSTVLVRALGETTCRTCGTTQPGVPEQGRHVAGLDAPATSPELDATLASEVEAALDRVLHRPPSQ